jgi:hypothetical protein
MRLGVERDGPRSQFGDGHTPGSTAIDVERPANAVRLVGHERAVDIPPDQSYNVRAVGAHRHGVVGSPFNHLWTTGPATS